jgi:hypothetical protein
MRPLPAIGLFFLAPLVAEFLLGNLPIKMLGALVALAPMYGGGALLIRELVRRAGRGWPSIALLGLAYGILEEGFTTQSLFNPNYLSLNLHLLEPAYIRALGIGGHWTIFVLTLHVAWSICVPIALIEAAVPGRADTPWLGGPGLTITALLFAFGIAFTTFIGFRQDRFMSSTGQFAVAALVIVLLVIAAFRFPRATPQVAVGWTPSPWLVGALALAAGSAVLLVPAAWGWWAAAADLAIDVGVAAMVLRWGSRAEWNLRHKLALGAGAAFAYAWHAFVEKPVMGGAGMDVRIGNAVFALGAVLLIAFAAKRTARYQAPSARKEALQ